MLNTYASVLRVAIAERIAYRTDFFLSTFLRFIPIITTIVLWEAIYEGSGKESIGDLTKQQMVGYYLMVMIVRAFGSMPSLASTAASDIRDGNLRKYLLQPIGYMPYQLTLMAAHKIVFLSTAWIPFGIVMIACRSYLPSLPDITSFALILLCLLFTFLMGFLINFTIGLLGFYFLEVRSFIHVFFTVQYFLSGHFFPLSLLPDTYRQFIQHLPFAYETYYPTLVMLGRTTPWETLGIIAVQLQWILILLAVQQLLWWQGVRRYSAYGG